jgi:hypothetical protein
LSREEEEEEEFKRAEQRVLFLAKRAKTLLNAGLIGVANVLIMCC